MENGNALQVRMGMRYIVSITCDQHSFVLVDANLNPHLALLPLSYTLTVLSDLCTISTNHYQIRSQHHQTRSLYPTRTCWSLSHLQHSQSSHQRHQYWHPWLLSPPRELVISRPFSSSLRQMLARPFPSFKRHCLLRRL